MQYKITLDNIISSITIINQVGMKKKKFEQTRQLLNGIGFQTRAASMLGEGVDAWTGFPRRFDLSYTNFGGRVSFELNSGHPVILARCFAN